MNLYITSFKPSLPTGYSIESYNNRHPNTDSKTDPDKSNFSTDAVIVSLSPESLTKSQSPENPTKAETETGPSKTAKSPEEQQLNTAEKQVVQKLQLTDLHVKMHEQQHIASAGSYARGGPSFQYIMGPDGESYAVGGEVALDTNPISNNPQATIVKAQVVRQAALAPSDPSGADRAIAAAATQMEAQARTKLMNEKINAPFNSVNNSHYFMKAYQNTSQYDQVGNCFNKIA